MTSENVNIDTIGSQERPNDWSMYCGNTESDSNSGVLTIKQIVSDGKQEVFIYSELDGFRAFTSFRSVMNRLSNLTLPNQSF